MIPPDFIQALLQRVDIVDVIDTRVPLKKSGSNFAACCPFHSEKTPSFTVSPSKQFYHCFGCGAHGTAISFLMEHEGLPFIDAVKELAQKVGLTVPESASFSAPAKDWREGLGISATLVEAARYYREQLKQSPQAIAYLKKRGLSGQIAARFAIGYAPDGWQNLAAAVSDYRSESLVQAGLVIDGEGGKRYDRFRDRVMFPIFNQKSEVIGFGGRVLGAGEPKYLNSPETPVFEKGRELYGLSLAQKAIRAAGKVVVVEGYMDVVALAQHGIEYVVATLGTATSAAHVQRLLRLTDNIVFCFDGDAAGRRAAWRALEVALPLTSDGKQIAFLFLPQGEDPDTYVRQNSPGAFEALLSSATPMSAYFLQHLSAGSDLKSEEGRASLIHKAKPLIREISAPALSLMLQKRLAEVVGISREEMNKLLGLTALPR
jgi:DNA primase